MYAPENSAYPAKIAASVEMLMPDGRNSGSMIAKKNRTVISGMPRMISMNSVDRMRKIGIFDVRASAKMTPSGNDANIT